MTRAAQLRRFAGIAAFAVTAAFLAAGPAASAGTAAPRFVVIVNPSNPEDSATAAFVASAFLKKITQWPDGTVIKPADQTDGSAVRTGFTDRILDRSVAEVRTYWQQQIFSGNDVPPPELAGDDAVVTWVLREPGAIGYVSANADLRTAKILKVK